MTTCARTRYAVLTIGEAAAYLGLTKSTVDSYRHRGRFPAPDGWRGRRPLWLPETLDTWQAGRWGAAIRRGYAYPNTDPTGGREAAPSGTREGTPSTGEL